MSIADHDIALIRTEERGVWKIKIDDTVYLERVGLQDNIIEAVKHLVYKIEATAQIRNDIDRGVF